MPSIPTDTCPFCFNVLRSVPLKGIIEKDDTIRLQCNNCRSYYVYLNKLKKIMKFSIFAEDNSFSINSDILNEETEINFHNEDGTKTILVSLLDYSDFRIMRDRVKNLRVFL